MRIFATLALLAAIVGGVAFEARAWTSCTTNCYGNTCTRTCY